MFLFILFIAIPIAAFFITRALTEDSDNPKIKKLPIIAAILAIPLLTLVWVIWNFIGSIFGWIILIAVLGVIGFIFYSILPSKGDSPVFSSVDKNQITLDEVSIRKKEDGICYRKGVPEAGWNRSTDKHFDYLYNARGNYNKTTCLRTKKLYQLKTGGTKRFCDYCEWEEIETLTNGYIPE